MGWLFVWHSAVAQDNASRPSSDGPAPLVGKSLLVPPAVNAGVDRVVVLGGKTYLRGALTELGQSKATKVMWSKESGLGEVTFEDVSAPITTATFSDLGDYTLKLTASLDDMTSADTLRVQVVPAATEAHLEPVYTLRYKINSLLWNNRLKAVIVNWIPHCYTEISDLELPQGGIANLIEAGKKLRGEPAKAHVGFPFSNAWVYNTLESMCLAQMVDPQGDQEISRRAGNNAGENRGMDSDHSCRAGARRLYADAIYPGNSGSARQYCSRAAALESARPRRA